MSERIQVEVYLCDKLICIHTAKKFNATLICDGVALKIDAPNLVIDANQLGQRLDLLAI